MNNKIRKLRPLLRGGVFEKETIPEKSQCYYVKNLVISTKPKARGEIRYSKRDGSFDSASSMHTVAVPDKIFGLTPFLDFIDRGHSLRSLYPPQAALPSLPLKMTILTDRYCEKSGRFLEINFSF